MYQSHALTVLDMTLLIDPHHWGVRKLVHMGHISQQLAFFDYTHFNNLERLAYPSVEYNTYIS